jgi:hypothetical protein
LKRTCPFIWTIFIPSSHGCFILPLIKSSKLFLEKMVFKNVQSIITTLLLSPLGERGWPSFEQFWIPLC